MNNWLQSHGVYLPKKCSTAIEWQIGRVYGRWCHLKGGNWANKAWWHKDRWSISECSTLSAAPTTCQAGSDGECDWCGCPQIRDGEPKASGRSCPIYDWNDDER